MGFLINSRTWMGNFNKLGVSLWQFCSQRTWHLFDGICLIIRECLDTGLTTTSPIFLATLSPINQPKKGSWESKKEKDWRKGKAMVKLSLAHHSFVWNWTLTKGILSNERLKLGVEKLHSGMWFNYNKFCLERWRCTISYLGPWLQVGRESQ